MLERRALLFDFDPRSPRGYQAWRSRPAEIPDTIPAWNELIKTALEQAALVDLDTAEMSAVEQHREENEDLDLLASLNPPQYYQRDDQFIIQKFLSALSLTVQKNENDTFALRLRDAMNFINYGIDNKLLLRIGQSGEIELERNDLLVPVGRQGEPMSSSTLDRWSGPGRAECEAAEDTIDKLFVHAEQLGIDATQAAQTEIEIRWQPAPGRLRQDEDIEDLLTLADAVISRIDATEYSVSQAYREQLYQLATLLRFARTEKLLLASRHS